MRAFSAVCLLFISFALSSTVVAQLPNATFVDAHYGSFYIPPPDTMNNTLWYVLTVEEEDLDYYYASVATRDAAYYKNDGQQSVPGGYGTLGAGVMTRNFVIIGGSPVSALQAGDWRVNAFLFIQGEVCDPIQPEICWPTINCSRYHYGEPCFDEAQGYIN